MEERNIALDHHTHCCPSKAVIDRMTAHFHTRSFQPDLSSIYTLVNASFEDVFEFTSSAAEAVSQVIWSVFLEVTRKEGKTQFITSCIEDAPTFQMLKRCESLGCSVKIAPIDREGKIDVKALAALISPRTALITCTIAQGLTGVIQPIEEICRIAKKKNVLLHLEASYAVGNSYVSFRDSAADYLTFSGERIHSVPASGALFAKKNRPLVPFVPSRSADTPSLVALCAAASFATLAQDAWSLEGARLRDLLEEKIQERVPEALLLFKKNPRLPNTTAIVFPRVHAEALLYYLQRKKLYPNQGGTYCQHLDRLLLSSEIQGESALSFSLSRMTTQEEIMQAAERIGAAVASLRKLSEDLF